MIATPLDVIGGSAEFVVVNGETLGLLRQIPDASVDAIITDPPYSSGGAFRGDRVGPSTNAKYVNSDVVTRRPEFAGDTRDQRSFGYWSALWLSECLRIAKPGAMLCLFSDWRQLPTVTDAMQAGGWSWRGIAVWDKTEGSRPRLGAFRAQSEFIVWGSAGPMNEAVAEKVGALPGVFRCMVLQDDKFHVTGKPTQLMCEVVKICRRGGTILDPFCGSGTTLVAAVLNGRKAIGFEISAEYSDIARKRAAAAVASSDWRQPNQLPLLGDCR